MGKKTELLEIAKQIRGLVDKNRGADVAMAWRLVVEVLKVGAFSGLEWFQFRQRLEPSFYFSPVRPDRMLGHAVWYLTEHRSELPIPLSLEFYVLPPPRHPWEPLGVDWAMTNLPALASLIEQEANGERETPPTPEDRRNEWFYDEWCKGSPWGNIRRRLNKKPKTWPRIDSDNGIRLAARRYADKHGLPHPPSRKAGRPAK